MNIINPAVHRLVIKDCQLYQKMTALYLVGGIVGLAILSMPHLYCFYMGCIILMTVMIAAGFHMINLTIINEKKEQTLPFMMSLPIRPLDYALGKLVANMLIFLVPWLMLTLGLVFITFFGPIPDGLLPFMLLILIQLVVNYLLVLSLTIITESEGWSIFAMVIVNLFLNPVIMLIARDPAFYQHFESENVVWIPEASVILAVQMLICVVCLAAVYIFQARRRTFI
jgi:ABC-2 type transport system permease protein